MAEKTACGLDCYDACRILHEEGRIRGDADHPAGNGALCAVLNRYMDETERITKPRVEGKEVSMEEALAAVAEAFKAEKSLLWRGSGNVGVMQEVTDLFMEQIGGCLTKGSLCDGAGAAGIAEGRGVNRTLPLEQIEKSEVVVVWGRNLTVTNSHLMPYLEGKKLIVIDPVRTEIAKKADVFLQVAPRTDYYIAIMLARFIFMEDSEDKEWMEEFAPDFEEFYDYTREHRIKAILNYIDLDLGDFGRVLNYLRDRKVVFLVGTGVQKYSTGSYTLHAIDSLAAVLGLFGREGCGVSYLGESRLGFVNPFETTCKRVSKVDTEFGDFDTVLVQGGNPAASMPDSNRVIESLEGVENLIYFGLHENETSKMAKIVIPARTFFEKEDVRLSYGHQYVTPMKKIKDSAIGISEYDFTQYLFGAFGFSGLESEEYYINAWLSQCEELNGELVSPAYEALPYSEGFGKEGDEEFAFIEEFNDDFVNTKRFTKYRKESQNKPKDETLWLLSPKSKKSINTQFVRDNRVELNPVLGFKEGEKVKVSSEHGEYIFEVQCSEYLRGDTALITNNTIGVNYLTPSIISDEGESACYQEVKVRVERV
ncbi:MAG: molybdopterin-dependent oxidoreductase [Sulfurovum sp.]|nr:molybdopterin-dependent oxidoreductase [Sulfurovum sp.]